MPLELCLLLIMLKNLVYWTRHLRFLHTYCIITKTPFAIVSSEQSVYALLYDIIVLAVVATDKEKIAECCRGFGADVIMTSEECKNGFSFLCFILFILL